MILRDANATIIPAIYIQRIETSSFSGISQQNNAPHNEPMGLSSTKIQYEKRYNTNTAHNAYLE